MLAQASAAPAGLGLVTSLESPRRQAEFPFSFPSFCYFGAVPRGKTHLTHEAFPEPARWPSARRIRVRGRIETEGWGPGHVAEASVGREVPSCRPPEPRGRVVSLPWRAAWPPQCWRPGLGLDCPPGASAKRTFPSPATMGKYVIKDPGVSKKAQAGTHICPGITSILLSLCCSSAMVGSGLWPSVGGVLGAPGSGQWEGRPLQEHSHPPPPRELSGAGRGSPGAGAGQEGPAALEAGGQLPGAWETPGPDRGPKRARMPPRRPLAWEWCKQGVLGAWECEGDSGAAAPQCPHPQIRGPWLGGTQISDPGTSRGTHAQRFPCHGDPPLP